MAGGAAGGSAGGMAGGGDGGGGRGGGGGGGRNGLKRHCEAFILLLRGLKCDGRRGVLHCFTVDTVQLPVPNIAGN